MIPSENESSASAAARVRESLWRAYRDQRLAQGYLFMGPAEASKREMALNFAQLLICEKGEGCGVCGSCRRVVNAQSESLLILAPESGVIKIEAARTLLNQLALSSLRQYRVVLIESAETLNPQASNVLLKTLEEPPEKTIFIFLTDQPQMLLTTIRSRLVAVRFQADRLAKGSQLEGLPDDLAEAHLKSWQMLVAKEKIYLSDVWRPLVDSKETALETIRLWSQWLHSARAREWAPQIKESALLERMSARPEWLDRIWPLTLDLQAEILGNVDRQLAFESYFRRLIGTAL